jgi:hypothetical protein
MNPYISVFDIFEDNKSLKERISVLETELNISKYELIVSNQKNIELKEKFDNLIHDNAVKILEYFHSCCSIIKTACRFGIEMEELYELIPQWDGCRDGLQNADDYVECRIEVIGRREYDEELEEDMTTEQREFKERQLDADEVNQIINDYICSDLTLYELADRYDLQINYLFKLLKENKLIEKETDAKGYASFYEEHMGSGCEWDRKSILDLI